MTGIDTNADARLVFHPRDDLGEMLEAARLLAAHDPAPISVRVTHALFVGDAEDKLRQAGVGHIWSCDAVPHPSNAAPLAELLARALRANDLL